MKSHITVIVLLLSIGGFAAVAQTSQGNGTASPQPASPPTSGSQKQLDQPAQEAVDKSFEPPAPTPAPSQQQTISPNLEKSLVGLTEAVTKLVDKQGEQESSFGKGFKYVIDGAAALVSIIGCILGIITFRKLPWFEKNKPLIWMFFGGVLLVVVLCLISDLITVAFYLLFGFIMLLVAVLIATAHLISFIDNNPKLKARIQKEFPELFDDRPASDQPA